MQPGSPALVRQSHSVAGLAGFGDAREELMRNSPAGCVLLVSRTGVAVKGGTIMAHSVFCKSRRIGRTLKIRVGAMASSARILGVLTILGLLTVASLRAQDRAQP